MGIVAVVAIVMLSLSGRWKTSAHPGAISSHLVLFGTQSSKIMGVLAGEMKECELCMPSLTAAASIQCVVSIFHVGDSFYSALQMRKLRNTKLKIFFSTI